MSTKSIGALKLELKAAGMSQAGDKGTLEYRARLLHRCLARKLVIPNSEENPCSLKLSQLRKAAASLGVSVIGNQDEILEAVVDHLEKNQSSPSSDNAAAAGFPSSSSSGNTEGRIDVVKIASRVLQLGELEDYEGILNLATVPNTPPLSRSSSVAAMRKAYLKLSLLLHPDKLPSSVFGEATKAFQTLVKAFEYLSSADELHLQSEASSSSSSGKVKTPLIARSNEGCFRTSVSCPRCKQAWSENTLDGNPDYFYNFLMTGLKQFTCSTCLCEFGCVTAIHRCPFCRGKFEYSPQDYHRKISCGNLKCKQTFGFYMYHVSERVLKALKLEIKEELERRRKSRETKMRRAAAAERRNPRSLDEESAFTLGLSDCCPRCGIELEECGDEEASRRHLMECNDENAHRVHKTKKEKARKSEMDRVERENRQEDLQTRAAWELLGADSSQLFLLNESQLRSMAADKGVSSKGSKDELISRLVGSDAHEDEQIALRILAKDGGNSSSALVQRSIKRKRIDPHKIPSNLSALSVIELKSICAAHGIEFASNAHKSDLIRLIESDIYSEDLGTKTDKKEVIVVDDDSENDDGEDYEENSSDTE